MITKETLFEERLQLLASRAKALAHPARLSILQVLARKGECICGELVEELPLAQSSVSQHLKELKRAGFIKGEVEGPRMCYCIDVESLRTFREEFDGFFDDIRLSEIDAKCC